MSENDDEGASSGEGESGEPSSGDKPARKRTKSAELAALVPKISNPSEPSGSSLFDSGWDSLLGDNKPSGMDDLFAPPSPSSSGSAEVPSFEPPLGASGDADEGEASEQPSEVAKQAPEVGEQEADEGEASEQPSEAAEGDDEAEAQSDADEAASEEPGSSLSKPTTEPRNSTKVSEVAGAFAGVDPEVRAAQEAIAEAAVKARDAAIDAEEVAEEARADLGFKDRRP